ncbi:hypothetical protein C6500_12135 [Candidatus Poribacteria bacterium]|nr:MAG: hypothetical protein C6500_12135 [Candidatus Poribacteria bacterium]
MKLIALLLFPILLLTVQPSMAIREGTATADVFIRRYAQSGDFGRLALWHEAAAECLTRISVPMNEIAYAYYKRRGYEKWAARAEKEAHEIQELHQYHRTRAKTAWQKFGGDAFLLKGFPDQRRGWVSQPVLNTERENIAKFIETWLPRYPNRFYEFGIYPTFFKKQRALAEQKGDSVKVLRLEADAAEMCAAQYERIPIAYGLRNYEKHRDAYRQYATHLRKLAQQNPNALPSKIDKGRRILDSLGVQTVPSQQTVDAILQIAQSNTQVKTALADQHAVHAYPTFQGFVWIVNFSNHSRGNLATAIIGAKTLKVLDVCISNLGGSGLAWR